MKELLFSSTTEREALENVLAFNQIRKCEEVIDKYEREIGELREEISAIIKSEEISKDYVELITKVKDQLKGISSSSTRLKEIDSVMKNNDDRVKEFDYTIKELESELESLKRLVFESDDASVIEETQAEIDTLSSRLSDLYELVQSINNSNTAYMIEEELIKADNNTNYTDNTKVELSNELRKLYTEFESEIETLDLPVREDIEFCMKKIKNREAEIARYEARKDSIVATYPDALDLDFELEMTKLDELLEELSLLGVDSYYPDDFEEDDDTNIFDSADEVVDEEQEDQGPVLEDDSDSEPNKDLKDTVDNGMVRVESVEKPSIDLKEIDEDVEDTDDSIENEEDVLVDNSSSFSTIGSVPYIFSEGESLESIAEKVYPSKDCWEAIYNYNKEEINSYLTANGMSTDPETIKTLASDKYLFAGIQLNIPTDSNYRG